MLKCTTPFASDSVFADTFLALCIEDCLPNARKFVALVKS